MTNFHFRLERVLRWRRLELVAEEARLKRLIAEEAQIRAHIEALRMQKLTLSAEVSQLEGASGADFNCAAAYALRLARDQDKAVRAHREKQRETAAQMQAHQTARLRERLLEELRSRQLHEWRQAASRELDAIAGESYLSRWPPM
jgi:hypothetical protein